MVEFVKKVILKLSDPKGSDFSERASRMAMAHCLITYTAFFDTVRKLFPEVWKSVSSVDVRDLSNFKNRGAVVIDDKAAGENANDMFHDKAKTDLGDIGIPAPHPGHSTKDSEQ